MNYGLKTVVKIPIDGISLDAFLTVPEESAGLVIFSHGKGSSRFSSRNNFVADELNKQNIATLLVNLLTANEDELHENRFEISLLTKRFVLITQWVLKHPHLKDLPIGLFGASTGAASALNAAAILQNDIKAVVSRGGRTDLAKENALPLITAQVLLIAGSLDTPVILMNKETLQKLRCKKDMIIINGASHLFEEFGKLKLVTQLTTHWFIKSLVQPATQYSTHIY